jgi:hypothetical protein
LFVFMPSFHSLVYMVELAEEFLDGIEEGYPRDIGCKCRMGGVWNG